MQLDEDLDKLDSASVLQVQAAAAAAAATGKGPFTYYVTHCGWVVSKSVIISNSGVVCY